MVRRLTGNVYVAGHGWFGPDYPQNTLNADAEKLITRADLWDGEDDREVAAPVPASPAPVAGVSEALVEESSDDPAPPPHGGPGSGKAAWAEYAASRGVEVKEGAERSEIIDALKSAGKRTE